MQVPLLDLRPQYASLKAEILAEIAEICDSQRFILGPKVEEFEQALAAYCRSGAAVGVTRGSDAHIIALWAAGIGAGVTLDSTGTLSFAQHKTFDSLADAKSYLNSKAGST